MKTQSTEVERIAEEAIRNTARYGIYLQRLARYNQRRMDALAHLRTEVRYFGSKSNAED